MKSWWSGDEGTSPRLSLYVIGAPQKLPPAARGSWEWISQGVFCIQVWASISEKPGLWKACRLYWSFGLFPIILQLTCQSLALVYLCVNNSSIINQRTWHCVLDYLWSLTFPGQKKLSQQISLFLRTLSIRIMSALMCGCRWACPLHPPRALP